MNKILKMTKTHNKITKILNEIKTENIKLKSI